MYSWPGLGWAGGLVRGSQKSNFTDREAPSGKYSTCENGLPRVEKITDSIFSAETVPLEGRMLAQIYGQHFLCSFRLSIKFLPAADPLPEKTLQGALRLCFPDSLNLSCWHSHPLLPHVNTDCFLPLTNPQCWRSHLEICWFALSCMDWHAPWPKWGFWYVHRIETEWKKNRVKEWKEHKLGFQDHVANKCADVSHTFAGLS